MRWASVACGVAGALFGLITLAGWILDNEALKGSFVAGITMKTNAAIGITLTGALVVLLGARRSSRDTALERALAALVAVIGLLTLLQHLFGVDFGIDQLIFREPAGALATQSPNRMGPVASLGLFLLGVARLALRVQTRSGVAPFQYIVLAVTLITSAPLLGYLFDARMLFGIGKYTGIALPTALALWLHALGLLLAQPEVGFMRRLAATDSGALLVRRLLPAAILIPVLLMIMRVAGQELGLYDQVLGRALVVIAFIIVFSGVVWRTGEVVRRQAAAAARAERELHEQLVQSLEQFRTLGEAVPDLLWMMDGNGAPLYQNPAWTRYTGLSAAALEARDWQSVAHPEDRAVLEELWTAAKLSGEPLQREARLSAADGAHRWFSLRLVPVRDESDAVVKWIGAATDIDDEKRTREALADADRRKTEFLAVLAHELRNPLAPVRNAVHVLRSRGDSDPESLKTYALIERQVEHLARLIDDLMDVSRISRDKLELRKSKVGLRRIISAAVEGTRYLVDAHRHRLNVTLPPDDVQLEADGARLVQVFTNLLTNAARYTPAGGTIDVMAQLDGDGAVTVSVTDDGVGIREDQLARIFDMFFQAEADSRRGRHGLGIGLSLVKKLVELHGGSVSVHSAGPGRGSTFAVRFPSSIVEQAAESPSSGPVALARFAGACVLVVEDNQDSAEMLAHLLRMTGASVHVAHDGESGLALAAEVHPQIVLLDIGLPGISGYEVARELRRTPWGTEAFVVALTGWGQSEDRARSADAGVDQHLVKPVDPDQLLAAIAAYQSGAARAGATESMAAESSAGEGTPSAEQSMPPPP